MGLLDLYPGPRFPGGMAISDLPQQIQNPRGFLMRAILAPWYSIPDWAKSGPFILLHLACLMVLFVTPSVTAVVLCVLFYVARMFGITAGFHRYFSHRSYKTSRFFQFCLAWLGCSALQRGPLWWSSHHRHHHQHSDQDNDVHSPIVQTFWYSHIGWVISSDANHVDWRNIKDIAKFAELRWLDRNHWVPGLTLAVICYLIDGWSGVAWGFLLSTVILYHGTFTINSLTHLFGKRRFPTTDESRNHWLLAIITLGEGWHNNHHYYQVSANQGFYWWEYDISFAILRFLSWFGLVWDLKRPPAKILDLGKRLDAESAIQVPKVTV